MFLWHVADSLKIVNIDLNNGQTDISVYIKGYNSGFITGTFFFWPQCQFFVLHLSLHCTVQFALVLISLVSLVFFIALAYTHPVLFCICLSSCTLFAHYKCFCFKYIFFNSEAIQFSYLTLDFSVQHFVLLFLSLFH